MTYSVCPCSDVCGLVFLLFTVGLPLGNRFHKISRMDVASQRQQSWHSSEEHVEGENWPPLICWDSVCVGSAGVQRCSDVAPLGLREQQEEVNFMLYVSAKFRNHKDVHINLSHGPCKEDGPVQHPAAPRCFQAIEEDSQQRQSIEQVHQHLQEGHRVKAETLSLTYVSVLFLQTDHNPGETNWVFEVGLILINVGEAGVKRTLQHHLRQRRRRFSNHTEHVTSSLSNAYKS